MIDDIEDNSKLRRGVPVAHSIFGVPSVINGANYAYFLALEKCHSLRNTEAMDVSETIRASNDLWFHFVTDISRGFAGICGGTFELTPRTRA